MGKRDKRGINGGESSNYIYIYVYIYLYKYFGIHSVRTFCPITIHNTVQVPQKINLFSHSQDRPPAAVQLSESKWVGAQLCLLNLKTVFFRALASFHNILASEYYYISSQILRIAIFPSFPPLLKSTSQFFKWRFPPPRTPTLPGLWKG